jgi:hypothetical protein
MESESDEEANNPRAIQEDSIQRDSSPGLRDESNERMLKTKSSKIKDTKSSASPIKISNQRNSSKKMTGPSHGSNATIMDDH